MSSEKDQNTQNNQEKPIYYNLFNSLVKESEKKQTLEKKFAENKNDKIQNKIGSSSSSNREQNKNSTVPLKSLRKKSLSHIYNKTDVRQPAMKKTYDKNQGRFCQAVCPYCGKKIGFLKMWMLKNKGNYSCDMCGSYSIIVINKVVVPMAIITVLISILMVLIFTFLVDMQIWSIILIFIPFFIFFCVSIFTVRLKKVLPAGKKKKKKSSNYDESRTRIL